MAFIENINLALDESTADRNGRQHTQIYKVRLSDSASTENASARIQLSGQLPGRWAQHPNDEFAYVDSIDVNPDPGEKGSARHFIARVTYSTPEVQNTSSDADPLDQPPTVSWDSVRRRVIVYKDKDGLAIRNSAGDWFDPPIEEERSYPRATIVRNEDSYDPNIADDYRDAINADTVDIAGLTVSPYQALLRTFQGDFRQQDGQIYYQVRYVIEFDPGTWIQSPVDQGYRAYDGSGNKGRIVQGTKTEAYKVGVENGEPIDEPARLNGAGQVLGKTQPASATEFGAFHTRNELDFWRLGLPRDMPGE